MSDPATTSDPATVSDAATVSDRATVVERVHTDRGELVLRRVGAGQRQHFEIISNGVFLMDTRSGASERVLVRAALGATGPGARLLIGGLGVGFSLAEAAEAAGPARPAEIVVVEIEEALIGWHRGPLAPYSRGALRDPRVRVVPGDILSWLAGTEETVDAICLDTDNGPDWTVFDSNAGLYGDDGLALLRRRLAPGGALAVWSAAASPRYAARLAAAVGPVTTLHVPVPRGEPDVIYLARRA